MFKYYIYKFLRRLHLISQEKYAAQRLKHVYRKTKEYQVIARSPLFDAKWYLARNPDVEAAGIDPIMHYLNYGWKENRPCTPYFDGKQYLEMYPDVKQSHMNPLLHWELYGRFEDRYAETKERDPRSHVPARSWKCILKDWFLYPVRLQQEVEQLKAEVEQLKQGK